MRYVVLGAGAVGGVVGGNLHLAGIPVTFVARGAHLDRLQEDGLLLDRADGRHVVRAPAVTSPAEVAWTDDTVVLLAVKGHQTAAALDDLAAHAPACTVVVSLQNGVANEAAVLRRFAAAYSVCVMLPATHLEPGVVVQKCWPVPGILDIGRVPHGADPTCEAIAADLRAAGFESVPRALVAAWKHRKLLMNVGNAVDAVCEPGPAADELAALATEEGELVLRTAGVPLVSAEEDRERRGDVLRRRDDLPVPVGGSTWQSLARGAVDTEVDYLAGEVVLLGRLHGVPTPVNELLQRVVHEHARAGAAPRTLDAAGLLETLHAG
ncbi:ketopantoate reductase family protein [Nocardioides dongkuii]|uniref:ketopantoate reductase family protein n=1 Tax=Nocardioides dongkuii TaxID=2760089 RepID=UPI0015FC55B0|nr:2-dehydropantoate 2-reductase [Nocardioides dongkuii]